MVTFGFQCNRVALELNFTNMYTYADRLLFDLASLRRFEFIFAYFVSLPISDSGKSGFTLASPVVK